MSSVSEYENFELKSAISLTSRAGMRGLSLSEPVEEEGANGLVNVSVIKKSVPEDSDWCDLSPENGFSQFSPGECLSRV